MSKTMTKENPKKKIEDWDFEPETRQAIKILQQLEKFIIKNYGPRCKTKAVGCESCKIWALYDLFKINLW